MNMEKVYIDENTWFIDNFLTQEELDWFKPWMDDPKDWYTTMRSPYKNILNKFIGNVNKYDENGDLIFPTGDNEFFDLPIFSKEGGIWERLHKVLPPHYRQHATLQTFKYMTDNEIQENLTEETRMHLRGFNENGTPSMTEHPVDFAMWWHEDTNPNQPTFNMSFSLYLNDDFEGGELVFKDKPITIKPKAGTLVGIPTIPGYTHKVNKVLGPNSRHTLYGNSWNDPQNVPVSTAEDC